MIKLSGYLKPFIILLLLAVALLFGQAVCDLNLPNFMSDIVNVGIQQNGLEHAAPAAISENGMALMTAFMSESDRASFTDAYTLVSSSDKSSGGETYSAVYPEAEEKLYIKKDPTSGALAPLDTAFGTAAWTMYNVLTDMAAKSGRNAGPAAAGDKTETSFSDIDLGQLYKILPMLGSLPKESIDAARAKALANDASILKQSGVVLSKAFLSELGADLDGIQSSYIMKIGAFMLGIALLGGAATVTVSLISSRIAAGVARSLRSDLFAKISSFSAAEFDRFSTASLITRCTNDVTQVQMLLTFGIRMVCYAPIMGIGGVVMAVGKSASMSWIIAVACTVLIGIIIIVMSIALPKFTAIQKLVDRLNLISRENLSGLMVIRAFGTREHEKKRFDAANRDLTATSLFINRVMAFMMPVMMLIMNGVTLLVVWVGAHRIASSSMQVGDMMAFIQYAMQIIMSFLMISMMFIFIPRAAVSGARISEVLGTALSVTDPEKPSSFNGGMRGVLEFRNVSFRYHGAAEDALSDISFIAKPGETTAIIGPTGAGKTTVANLALRFYDVTGGRVLVDGADVREVGLHGLRKKIGYAPQKAMLLSGSVASNLRYGKNEASDAEIKEAAETAQADGFISAMPEGYNSAIAQGGTNVSGGQKQRLSIARALARWPEIYIFDDAFSALDFKTDAALRRALRSRTQNSAVIVIAQRVSTIMNAEQIIVLDAGRIVGRGTHRQLLKECPQYYEIASSQLSQEELA